MRKHVASTVPNDSDSGRHHLKRYFKLLQLTLACLGTTHESTDMCLGGGLHAATCMGLREATNCSKQLRLNTLPSREIWCNACILTRGITATGTKSITMDVAIMKMTMRGPKKRRSAPRTPWGIIVKYACQTMSNLCCISENNFSCRQEFTSSVHEKSRSIRYIVRCQVFEPMFQPVQDSDRRSEEEDEDERAPRHRHRKEPEEDEVGVVWSIVAYCDLAIAKLIVGKVFLDILTVPEPCKNKIYLNRPIATFPRASCTLSILPNMVKQNMNARVPFASICWNLFPILEGWWGEATGGLESCSAEFVDGWG